MLDVSPFTATDEDSLCHSNVGTHVRDYTVLYSKHNLNHHNEGLTISHSLKDLLHHPTLAFRKKIRTSIRMSFVIS